MKHDRLVGRELYRVLDERTGAEFAIRDILPFLPGHSQRIVASAVQRFKDRGLLRVARLVRTKQSRYAVFAKTDLFFLGFEQAAALHRAERRDALSDSEHSEWSYRPLEDVFRRLHGLGSHVVPQPRHYRRYRTK